MADAAGWKGRWIMRNETCTAGCFGPRVEQADRLVAGGQWASGHAIVSKMLRCAQADGCHDRDACARAAHSLMGSVRFFLSN